VLRYPHMFQLRTFLALAVLIAVTAVGCGGIPTEPSDFEFGRIDVNVHDTDSQPVNEVPVRLDRKNGQRQDDGGKTGSIAIPGYYFFLENPGDYRVVITVPTGYTLAPGQTSTVDVSIAKNQTKTINFVLKKG